MRDEKLKSVWAKMERAKTNLHTLEAEVQAFLDSRPFEVASTRDPRPQFRFHLIFGAGQAGVAPVETTLHLITAEVESAVAKLQPLVD